MAPLLLLTVLIAVVIALDIVWPESRRREIGIVAAVGLFGIALVALIFGPPAQAAQQMVLGGMYRFDTLTQIFTVTTLVGAAIASLISLESHGIGNRGDYYTVLLTATLGALVICGA
jgi:NADH:ubiquinone oxidoreductase subunit 2 (subunit N)